MSVDHSKTIINIENIVFRYGNHPVLEGVNFQIHRGDYLGIIGPNGGGKTTLLQIMLGLLRPEKGTVQLFGTDVSRFREWEKIGYVPQNVIHVDQQFPATVAEVVAMGRCHRRGIGRLLTGMDKKKIDEALAQVGMSAHTDRLIGELSGGERQRVFIARALAGEPEVLFLDEPTIGVDVATQEQFYLLLKQLNESLGLTLILVSHDIDVVATQATELACINGCLIYHGLPQELDAGKHIKALYGKEMKFILHDH